MPDILDLALLPVLAFLCGITSLSDSREGKIRNLWILAGALWAVAVYAALSFSRLSVPGVTDGLVLNTLFNGSWGRLLFLTALNAALALCAGFLIFHFGLWSAGDAKLFAVLVMLLPLKYYFRHYIPLFPAFNLFLNTITVAALFVWTDTVWRLGKFALASRERNVWKEMAGATAAKFRGAGWLILLAGTVFSLLMCLTRVLHLARTAAAMLTLSVMIGLLFFGTVSNTLVENKAFRTKLGIFSGLLFAGLLVSPLRLQFLHMTVMMLLTFLVLYMLVGVLPALAAKYELGREDMPFAAWLSAGLLSTLVIKGSFLYLLLF